MKICPSCKETYTDDDLNFCLKDGSFLTSAEAGGEPKTIYMDASRRTNPNWQQMPNFEPPAVWQGEQTVQGMPGNRHPLRIASRDQTLPTISLILGILGILVVCCHGGIPLGAGAVAAGLVALNHEKSDPVKYGGRGLAMAGIVSGALAVTFGIVWLILMIVG